MVDLHSHVMYGVDDGARSKEMAINMLKLAESGGTRKLICTPHYFRGRFEKTFSEVKDELENLKKIAEDNNISLELYCGQEIYLTNYLLEDLEEGRIGTINNSKYMLIEMNMNEIPKRALDIIYELRLKGIVPIIAHPERYVPFMDNPELINDFIEEGCLFQLNGGSISGKFGSLVKKTAKLFLENNLYSFLGSDGHFDEQRNTNLSDAMDNIRNIDEELLNIYKENGEKVILNEHVAFKGKAIERKKISFFRFFKKK
ncbi:tyrosine-protein phosphatase [Clostridium massiliamazoniense]|uniref:tyrosine-protein phosphatase n=1 Tax=Clostridium massiliamazoniense TaxID=1347366 RepID=UPI0006D7E4AD|nr:CpsB/CapC family capsule biosynthesis tyrosine phosphatase [Clostridium massiliamazoniense]